VITAKVKCVPSAVREFRTETVTIAAVPAPGSIIDLPKARLFVRVGDESPVFLADGSTVLLWAAALPGDDQQELYQRMVGA
jgi:hypothetical protein